MWVNTITLLYCNLLHAEKSKTIDNDIIVKLLKHEVMYEHLKNV